MISSFVFARTSSLLAAGKQIASGAFISKSAIAGIGGVTAAGYSYQYSREKKKNSVVQEVLRGTEQELHQTKQSLHEEKALTRRLKKETKRLLVSNDEFQAENTQLVEACEGFKTMYEEANERTDQLMLEIGTVKNELLSEIHAVKTENQQLTTSVLELGSKLLSLETTGKILNDKVRSLEADNTKLSYENASLLSANTELQNRLYIKDSAAEETKKSTQQQQAIAGATSARAQQRQEVDQPPKALSEPTAAIESIEDSSSLTKNWRKDWMKGIEKEMGSYKRKGSTQRIEEMAIRRVGNKFERTGNEVYVYM